MSKKARAILTALVAVAAYASITVNQPEWAHQVEGLVLVLGAAFGIRPPHQE
jgi:hypothetical protein